MTGFLITQQLATELLEFLDNKDSFLGKLEACEARLGAHPVGVAFDREIVEELTAVQQSVAIRNLERANI
jgi:hypothetical protein